MNKLSLSLLLAVVTVSSVGACTPLRWQRPDTLASAAEADVTECRAIARRQSRTLNERPFLLPYFVSAGDDKGRARSIPVVPWQQFGPPVWWPYAPSLAMDRLSLKHELFQDCMQAKGYQLLADEQPAGETGVTSTDETPTDEMPIRRTPADQTPGRGEAAPR